MGNQERGVQQVARAVPLCSSGSTLDVALFLAAIWSSRCSKAMCGPGNCNRYCHVIIMHSDEERMATVSFRCGSILVMLSILAVGLQERTLLSAVVEQHFSWGPNLAALSAQLCGLLAGLCMLGAAMQRI